MNYKNLVKPWPAPFTGGTGSRGRVYYSAGTLAVLMAVVLPLKLTIWATWYAAYLYWVVLASIVYGTVKGALAASRAIGYAVRKHNIRKDA